MMKQLLLNNWNFMRILRLGLGIFILVQSVIAIDWAMGILGLLFTLMPICNISCCCNGCATAPPKKSSVTTKDTIYEEVV